jgi:phenylacetate-coenzyme A ligase PaaK-like adenylate-forming protein
LKQPVKNIDLESNIFAADAQNFTDTALAVFQFQYQNNSLYRQYCQALKINADAVSSIEEIPFLPIQFFKTHKVVTSFFEPAIIFESSGTTGTVNSRHYVKSTVLYKKSFTKAFEQFYGPAADKCVLGLLPSYLEKGQSSLVYMTDELIRQSSHKLSGFYLYDFEKLHNTILHNEILKQPTVLIGVTYALLDFAAQYPMQLRNTIVIETGGMKGRKEELTRKQVHNILQQQLGLPLIHSEYGMTELMSQAYSKGNGIFHCTPWMKILIREEDDPFCIYSANSLPAKRTKTGCLNIIDLANLYSCSFIATEDTGYLHTNETFEILGRIDLGDIRGCSLLAV